MDDKQEALDFRTKLLGDRASLLLDQQECAVDETAGNLNELSLSVHQATNAVLSLNGFERNLLFLNEGDGYRHAAAVSGLDAALDGRSFATGDVDGDGDLDVVVKNLQWKLLQLFLNEMPLENGRVLLSFRGTDSNRDGIGTFVSATHGERKQIAEVLSANSFQAQSPNEVFFGLGADKSIDKLEVRWTSGTTQTFENLEAGRHYVIDEAEGIVKQRPLAGKPVELEADDLRNVTRTRIFASPRPALPFNLKTLKGPLVSQQVFTKPTIVSFMTPWLPKFDEFLDTLEAVRSEADDIEIVVFLVHSQTVAANETAFEKVAARGFRVARAPYDFAARYVNQSNVLFPSSFFVVDSNIERDIIGVVDAKDIIEIIRNR